MSVENSVERSVEEVLASRSLDEIGRAFHAVNTDSTLAAAFKACSLTELERLSTSPQDLLILFKNYLSTEEARPFLLSEEVEEAMRVFCGVPEAVRRTAGMLCLVRRFYVSDRGTEEDTLRH